MSFYVDKIKKKQPYTIADSINKPLASPDKQDLLDNKDLSFSEFILVMKDGPDVTVRALHPVTGFLVAHVEKHESAKRERKKQEEMDRIAS